MTRSDAILAAVKAELELRRVDLDADTTLEAVTIVVKFDARDCWPRRILFRTESSRGVPANGRGSTASRVK